MENKRLDFSFEYLFAYVLQILWGDICYVWYIFYATLLLSSCLTHQKIVINWTSNGSGWLGWNFLFIASTSTASQYRKSSIFAFLRIG